MLIVYAPKYYQNQALCVCRKNLLYFTRRIIRGPPAVETVCVCVYVDVYARLCMYV